MTPADLARLHAASRIAPRSWSEAEFASLTGGAGAVLVADPQGFALGRALVGEAELLTLAVLPDARRQGVGRHLLDRFLQQVAGQGATATFLEVAQDNAAALALYRAAGFAEVGRRKAYYCMPDGQRVDAIVMRHATGVAPPEN